MNSFATFGLLCFGVAGAVMAQSDPAYDGARIVAIYNTVVASETPGIVRAIKINAGDSVAADQLLVQLNTEILQAEYDVAIAEQEIARLEASNRVNIDYAEKTAAVAERTLAKSLNANLQFERTISATEIERLRLQLEQAQLSGKQAELEFAAAQWTADLRERMLHAAQVKLKHRSIVSPLDGTVAQILVQPGQWLNAGSPIARVIDLKRLRVEGYFNENLIRQVKVGSGATFTYELDGQTEEIPLTVCFVSPEVVEGIFQVWADFDNAAGEHIPGIQGKLMLHIDQ